MIADDDLSTRYAMAKEQQAALLADEIITISDDSSEDALITEDGKRIYNKEFVNRSRLRVDARKWVAAHLLPKKYGDKLGIEHSGEVNIMAAVSEHLSGGGKLSTVSSIGSKKAKK